MAAKITDEEKQSRLEKIKETLSRRPDLTKNHFIVSFGYQHSFMKWCESQGAVFGKQKVKQIRINSRVK